MKRIALFALLLAAAAVSAQAAHVAPLQSTTYKCWYTNPPLGSANPGFSSFSFIYMNTTEQKRGIEYYDATWGPDNRKMTFAKPVDKTSFYVGPYTTWEFTFNPSGPQCKQTDVLFGGNRIDFLDCTDGHQRTCTTYW